MAGKTAGRKRRTPAVDIRAVTGVTYDELGGLLKDLGKTRYTLPYDLTKPHLKKTVTRALSPELFSKLERLLAQLITQRAQPWNPDCIRRLRWQTVCDGRDIGGELGWCEFQFAVDVLKGTPAEAGWKQMKTDFETVERTAPKRQPRVKRPRPRSVDAPCEGASRDAWVSFVRACAVAPGWPATARD
jgi:hypothetical protein